MYSQETQRILDQAMEYAKHTKPRALRYVSPELIGLFMVKSGQGELPTTLRGQWENALLAKVSQQGQHPMGLPVTMAQARVTYSSESKSLFKRCETMQFQRGDTHIRPTYLWDALFDTESPALHMDTLLAEFDPSMLPDDQVEPATAGGKGEDESTPASVLSEFCRNITDRARLGQLDPVIGRQRELRKMIQVLLKRKKNNPIMIGEAGVGKTAVVEGLAQRIFESDSPMLEGLRDRTILELDLMSLMGGTGLRGQLEERLKKLVTALQERDGQVILFIDEIHNLVGAGQSEGSGDIANFLKPALARGEIQVIGATTLAEYKKFIEPDPALMRRFDRVLVPEPSVEETEEILRRIVPKYESQHHVQYGDDVLQMLPEVAKQYFGETRLPDSAINLLDKLGASVRLRTAIEAAESQVEGEAPAEPVEAPTEFVEAPLIPAGLEALAKLVEDEKGVPFEVILQSPADRLRQLVPFLEERLYGQDQVKRGLLELFAEQSLGISRGQDSTVTSILLSGPAGTGKTHTAELLAEFLFPNELDVMTFDMSNYSEAYSAQSLKGPPVGIEGHDRGGILTEFVKHHPYCMLIFDNADKGHPEVHNLFREICQEGTVTDSNNVAFPLHNAVVVFCTRDADKVQISGVNRECGFAPLQREELACIFEREHKQFQESYSNSGYHIQWADDIFDALMPAPEETEEAEGESNEEAEEVRSQAVEALAQKLKEEADSVKNAWELLRLLEEDVFAPCAITLLQNDLPPGHYRAAIGDEGQFLMGRANPAETTE